MSSSALPRRCQAEGRWRIELLAVPEEDQRSPLLRLKEYPPHGSAQTTKDYPGTLPGGGRVAWNGNPVKDED
jgi:hypothetical protein